MRRLGNIGGKAGLKTTNMKELSLSDLKALIDFCAARRDVITAIANDPERRIKTGENHPLEVSWITLSEILAEAKKEMIIKIGEATGRDVSNCL